VFFPSGEGEEDGEDGGGEGLVIGFCHDLHYISVADISATDILNWTSNWWQRGPGAKALMLAVPFAGLKPCV
jgi:hypothetical protein